MLGDRGIDEALDLFLVTDVAGMCGAPGMFPATFRAAASLMSDTTTVAPAWPKRSAMAWPRPLPAPVMMATLPSSSADMR